MFSPLPVEVVYLVQLPHKKKLFFTSHFSMCINLRLLVPYKERASILIFPQSAFLTDKYRDMLNDKEYG
jgi:hypothetical protein